MMRTGQKGSTDSMENASEYYNSNCLKALKTSKQLLTTMDDYFVSGACKGFKSTE